MYNDDPYDTGRPRRTRRGGINWLTALVIFIVWLLLANHTIVFTDDPALVFLSKSSWTFNSAVIVERNRATFSLQHPILASRLAGDQGLWIFGR